MTSLSGRSHRNTLRSTVYSSFAFACIAATAAAAWGQELETVVVSGYRATLQSSIEAKRNSSVVEDGLSTKDIGSLPSLSIGSALETIAGAAGSPDNTGATEFAIRGLGPYLGLTTFNGRDITNGSGDRAVNFSVFPSELMSGVKLYKSQEADFTEGAVSGLIDLSLVHPLDVSKRSFSVEVKGAYNPYAYRVTSDRKQVGLRGTMQYVDQFDAGKLGRVGVAFGGQHDEANNAQEMFTSSTTRYACSVAVSTGKCTNYTTAQFAAAGTSYADQLAAGKAKDFYLVPSSYTWETFADESHRDAVFGAVEWQPNERIDVNIDGEFSGYYNQQDQQNLILNNGNYNIHNLTYDAATHIPQKADGSSYIYVKPNYHTRNEIYTGGGINVAYTATDKLTFTLDYGYSHTARQTIDRGFYLYAGYFKPTTKNGVTTYASTPANLYLNYSMDATGSTIPAFSAITDTTDLDVAHGAGPFDVTAYDRYNSQPRFNRENESRFDTINSYKFDAKYDVGGWIKSVSVGVRYSRRAYNYFDDTHNISLNSSLNTLNTLSDASFLALSNGKYVYKNPTTGADWYTTTKAANTTCRIPFTERNFLNTAGNTIHSWATFDPVCLMQQYTGTTDVGPFDPENRSPLSTSVKEEVWSGYAMAKFVIPLGTNSLSGNIGGRLVSTTESSSGLQAKYASIAVAGTSGTTYQFNPVPGSFIESPVGGSSTSLRFLPSLNLAYDLSDDLMLRLAIARTMARPAPSSLGTGFSLAADTSTTGYASPIDAVRAGSVSVDGNYALKPLMSWNYDLSLEYYMNADSMFTASVYYDSFQGAYDVGISSTTVNVDGVNYTMPYNQIINSHRKSYIYGLELQAITRFDFLPHPFDGLGVKAGYTYAATNFRNDDIQLGDATNPATGIVTPGMIPSASMGEYSPHVVSAQLYYDYGPFSAQAIYQHRSHWYQDFLGGNTQLRYYRAQSRLDLRMSYDITKQLQASANVYNVLNTPTIMDMPVVGAVRQYTVFGPRYYASLKYRL
jgi:TonB-dependent receptor